MKRLITVFAAGLILVIGSTVWADAPKLINFQGRLSDGSGNPVADGNYSVTFRIYNVPVGGAALWSEIQTVSTTGGIFNVLLGSATALPATVFDDTTRYLTIQVSPDPEMTPRQRLGSVGYSLASEQWSSLGSNVFRLNGNVGIGVANPFGTLELKPNGDIRADKIGSTGGQGSTLDLAGSQADPSPSRHVFIKFGDVGIGTTNPAQKLDVSGTAQMTGFKMPTGAANGFVLTSDASGIGTWRAAAGGGSFVNLQGSTPGTQQTGHLNISGTGLFGGNVGIGTTSPTKKLEVVGDSRLAGTVGLGGSGLTGGYLVNIDNDDVVGNNSGLLSLSVEGETHIGGVLRAGMTAGSYSHSILFGNLGVGTPTPSLAKLQVAGDIYTTAGLGFYPTGGGSANNVIYRGGTDFFILRNYNQSYTVAQVWSPPGNLGSTTAQEATLALVRGNEPNQEYLDFYNNGYPSETQFGIRMQKRGTGQYRDFVIDQSDGVTKTPLLSIKTSGNVGIGTATPGEKLDVVGNIKSTGGWFTANYDNTYGLRWGTSSTTPNIHLRGFIMSFNGDGLNPNFGFYSSSGDPDNAAKMYINSSGNVGIGTTSPDSKLDVNGNLEVGTGSRGAILSSSFNDNFQLRTFTNTPNPNFEIAQGNGSGGSAFTWISGGSSSLSLNPGSGNVGVGTTSPQSKLQVVGNYIQIPTISSPPPVADCDEAGEAGRMVIYIEPTFGSVTLYICRGAFGWAGL